MGVTQGQERGEGTGMDPDERKIYQPLVPLFFTTLKVTNELLHHFQNRKELQVPNNKQPKSHL